MQSALQGLKNEVLDLTAPAPGRPLRIVLVGFYNYESHALRIFHALLRQRGHSVYSVFYKNYFVYQEPTEAEEEKVTDLITRIQPDLVAMSVWSTYYQLAARVTRRLKASCDPTVIWGGIHAQTCPEDCLADADIVCRSEGEYVLAELTDRMSLGQDFTDLAGCWVRTDDGIVRNPPRLLIANLDALPTPDFSSDNKYYLGTSQEWRDVALWDSRMVMYEIMTLRGCAYECTFCIHNFTRKESEGLGSYIRRRSVDHVMRELRLALRARPKLQTVFFQDDIFAPTAPWLEEFCERYPREIGLPFAIYAFPRMVNEKKISLLRKAGLWAAIMGIQSGSDRVRRDCYERETSNQSIIDACNVFARQGVERVLDFISDNPYETDDDRFETVTLLASLPRPFFFNYFSLTYFPKVDLTERALRDGFIRPEDVEHIAQKGYHVWGVALDGVRTADQLRWDIAYNMACRGVPSRWIASLLPSRFFNDRIPMFAALTRRIQLAGRARHRLRNKLLGRPDLVDQYTQNATRQIVPVEPIIQPNADHAPLRTAAKVIALSNAGLHA